MATLELQQGEEIHVGDYLMTVGDRLFPMPDSSELLEDHQALAELLSTKGYVFLRNVLNRDDVFKARDVVADTLSDSWDLIDRTRGSLRDAFIKEGEKGLLLTGFRDVTHHPDTLAVLEGKELAGVIRACLGEPVSTYSNKWVRVMGTTQYTDEHSDFYRFGRNAKRMLTCWIPLGDYTPKQGCLVVCEGSHKLAGYTNEYYADAKIELPPGFEDYNSTATWRYTNVRAGDVIIFDIRTVHAATKNTTEQFRISMDTRWQPSSCVPDDSKPAFVAFEEEGVEGEGEGGEGGGGETGNNNG